MGRTTVVATVALAVACAPTTERAMLAMVGRTPVTAAVSQERRCLEIGAEARHGSWCAPDERPEAVWLGAADIPAHRVLVAGQAPPDVVSIVMTGDGVARELAVEDSDVGRFFLTPNLPAGRYEVEASRADGSTYVSGEMTVSAGATTLTTIAP